jgi:hypothetical protein
MMKRSILLLGALGVTLGANAQLQQTSVVQMHVQDAGSNTPLPVQVERAVRNHPMDQAKGAAIKTRWYNYVDQLAKANPNITASGSNNYVNYPYMWVDGTAMGIYTAANGVDQEADTIKLESLGSVLHPFWSGYNGSGDWPNGTAAMKSTDAYTVDSIVFYGLYGRQNTGSYIDTLRISYTYGNGGTSNLPIYYYSNMRTNYGTDTVRSAFPWFNPIKNIMMKPRTSTSTAPVMTKDVLLTDLDTGFVTAGVAANFSVPAGNLVAAGITFISGDPSFTTGDTVFRGATLNPNEPFKHGMFRPQVFVERLVVSRTPNFATYTPGNYNVGVFAQYPSDDSLYYPAWAWTTNNGTGASTYQFPYVDWKITCDCKGIGDVDTGGNDTSKSVAGFEQKAAIGMPFPNPAANSVVLPLQMKQAAAVKATLSNMMGQVIATQDLGKLAAGQTEKITFSTANLSNGVYMITIEADGNTITKRLAVTR